MQRPDASFPAPADREQLTEDMPADSTDRQKAIALALELAKRAQGAASTDEVLFILTNDLRILIEFDRALLISHIRGASKLVAASNQPIIEKKYPLVESVSGLATSLRQSERGIVLSNKTEAAGLSDEGLPPATKDALLAYVKKSGCTFLVSVPLKHNKTLLGHVLLEFYGTSIPEQIPVLTLLSIAPLLAAALAEKWLLQAKPGIWNQVFPEAPAQETARQRVVSIALGMVAVLMLVFALFAVPISKTIGGEAEVFSHNRHMAFVKIDGLVERITVKEGSPVEKGQVLAVLDRRDLDHDIRSAERRLEILTREMMLLRREAGQDPAKLAESEQVQLKRASAKEELDYLQWRAGFLEVSAPTSGIVVTKEVETMVGKRFRAGEVFCEIAAPRELWIAVYVPEDQVSLAKKGQSAEVFLNSDPSRALLSTVEEIAPLAQVLPRWGSVYRVSMPFLSPGEEIKVGMKGIGKIHTGHLSLFTILRRHVVALWNRYSLYL